MHTATRLAAPVIERCARAERRSARICAYGLYAPLNGDWLRSLGVDDVLGGEFEEDLTAIARDVGGGHRGGRAPPAGRSGPRDSCTLPAPAFLVPDRTGLPPLARYATLQMPRRHARGSSATPRPAADAVTCAAIVRSFRCTTAQFRVVQADVVLARHRRRRWRLAPEHITFGDPDFFNGPTHAHAHRRRRCTPRIPQSPTTSRSRSSTCCSTAISCRGLRDTGCLFVTSAVESVDDRVLALLDKGHTRRDFVEAVSVVPRRRADAGADLRRLPSVD